MSPVLETKDSSSSSALPSTSSPYHELPSPLPASLPRPLKKARKTVENEYGVTWLRWIQSPRESFRIISVILVLWLTWELISLSSFLPNITSSSNPLNPLLFISYPLGPHSKDGTMRYGKGWNDISFLVFWVLGFSFIRQGLTLHVIRKVGMKLGVKKGRKMERFMEQVRAIVVVFVARKMTANFRNAVALGVCCGLLFLFECFRPCGWFLCYCFSNELTSRLSLVRNVKTTLLVLPYRIFLDRLSSLGDDVECQDLLFDSICLLVCLILMS